MKTCQHADAGCNYPEGECAGFCAPIQDRPLAAPGLTSYRYRGAYGWIMIGAKDDAGALKEATRSTHNATATVDKLQRWDGSKYAAV